MPLQPQPYALQFQGGLDSQTDSKQVGYTKLIDLQNAVFTKNTTLVKRNGYKALGTGVDGSSYPYTVANAVTSLPSTIGGVLFGGGGGGTVTATFAEGNPAGLAARGDEPVLFINGQGYSHRSSTDTWVATGAVISAVAKHEPIARTGTRQRNADLADNNGVTCTVFENSYGGGFGGVWCEVTETATGRILLPATLLDINGQSPRVVAAGTNLLALWSNGQNLKIAVINTQTPESVPVAAILTPDLVGAAFDVEATFDVYYPGLNPAYIAWRTASGFSVGWLHPSGVLGTPVLGLPTVATYAATITGPIAVAIDLGYVLAGTTYVSGFGAVFYTNTDLHVQILNVSTPSDPRPTALVATGDAGAWQRVTAAFGAPNGVCQIWFAAEKQAVSAGVADTEVSHNLIGTGVVDQLASVTIAKVIRGHGLVSRAFYDDGDVYVNVVHPVLYFPYVATCRISGSMKACTQLLPGETSGLPGTDGPPLTTSVLPSVIPLSPAAGVGRSRQHVTAQGFRIQLSGTSGTQFGEQGIFRTTLDFDNADAYRTAQLGRGLYLSGALMQHYDGSLWAEANFLCAPDTSTGILTTSTQAGGNLTASATYNYKVLYEAIDGQGELHPGPVAVAQKITLVNPAQTVNIQVPTCRLTGRGQVRISVFRSLANQTGAPDAIPYYRVSSVDPSSTGANAYVANDPTVDFVTFQDQMGDATAETLEPLYTNGGILSNDPTPSAGGAITGGKNRLYWTDPADPHLVCFSQTLRDDTAVEMSAALTMRTDPYGGKVVGLSVMDDGVFAFKETAIYVVDGPGPDPDGGETTNNAFTPWALVTSDVGCKSPGSICQTPLGVTFQSQKGIKLLGRDRQVVDIGADVYGFNAQTIVRATLLPDRHQVVFLTDSGSTLLWDYLRGQWSRFTNHEGLDAIVVGGVYHYLRTDGRVFKETPGVYADDNAHIPMVIETAWVKMAGYLQGWQKILRADVIGNYGSSHTLNVRYRLNYNPAYSAPIGLTMDADQTPSLYGAGSYGVGDYGGDFNSNTTRYQRGVHLNKRCQAISFQFSDVEPTATFGPAFELSELLLTGGVIGVRYPMGATRSQ